MKVEHGKLEGSIQIDYELALHGMVTGNVTILKNGVLFLHGICCQNLVLEDGARVYLYGTVSSNVLNRAGYLEVYGVVGGNLQTEESGKTLVDGKAVIGGNQ